MEYLTIKNWQKFQRYRRDRGTPPWIALHRSLQRDPEWIVLTSEERGWLVDIWMLAAERDGQFPANPTLIQRLCAMNSAPDLGKLAHFIEGMDVHCQSTVSPMDDPNKDIDKYKDKDKEKEKPYMSGSANQTDEKKPPKTWQEDEKFVSLKLKFPKRSGSNSWPNAWKAYRKRLKDGHTFEEIAAGVDRYLKFCEATGKVDTETVMMMATFMGPGLHFQNDFRIPRSARTQSGLSQQGEDNVRAAMGMDI